MKVLPSLSVQLQNHIIHILFIYFIYFCKCWSKLCEVVLCCALLVCHVFLLRKKTDSCQYLLLSQMSLTFVFCHCTNRLNKQDVQGWDANEFLWLKVSIIAEFRNMTEVCTVNSKCLKRLKVILAKLQKILTEEELLEITFTRECWHKINLVLIKTGIPFQTFTTICMESWIKGGLKGVYWLKGVLN